MLSSSDLVNFSKKEFRLDIYTNASSNSFSVAVIKTASKLSVYSISGKEVISVSDYSGAPIKVFALTLSITFSIN